MGLLEKLLGKSLEMGEKIEIHNFSGRLEDGHFGVNYFFRLRGYRGTFKITWMWGFNDIYAELTREDVPRGYKREIQKIKHYKMNDIKK